MILPLFFENSVPFLAAGGVGLNKKHYDLSQAQNVGDYCTLELYIKTGGVSPGAAKNITIFSAFCTERLGISADELRTAAQSQVCLLPDAINTRRFYMTQLQYQGAGFLHVWYDCDALNADLFEGRLAVCVKRG